MSERVRGCESAHQLLLGVQTLEDRVLARCLECSSTFGIENKRPSHELIGYYINPEYNYECSALYRRASVLYENGGSL